MVVGEETERRFEMAESGGRIEVGAFVYENGSISGPADYMREQGFSRIKLIEGGFDHVFNYGVSSGESPSVEVAMLVSLQTDYAGWKGLRDFNRMRGAV
jgi:hypothetical protein